MPSFFQASKWQEVVTVPLPGRFCWRLLMYWLKVEVPWMEGWLVWVCFQILTLSRASTVAGVLLDVVLNKGVGGPSVDGDKDRAGLGGGGTAEVDLAVGSSLPALSDDEVTSVGEVDGVAVVGGRELNVATGLVVLVVILATS
jgi:hypothetical protein